MKKKTTSFDSLFYKTFKYLDSVIQVPIDVADTCKTKGNSAYYRYCNPYIKIWRRLFFVMRLVHNWATNGWINI